VSTGVARFFDSMAEDYEALEPWYAHLYEVLHRIARQVLRPRGGAGRALDAGCGTGFQTGLLTGLGYETHGVDISTRSLAVARNGRATGARLAAGDVAALPYPGECFDVAVCCGSTLNFLAAPEVAVAELGRVLRPGGRLLLEYEHKWSLDLAWALMGSTIGRRLGYGAGGPRLWGQLARRPGEGIWIDYPGYPALRLATRSEVARWLRTGGLVPRRVWAIHAVTGVIPSPALHRPRLSRGLATLYRMLRALDRAVVSVEAAQAWAAHLVLLAERVRPA